MGCVEEVLHNKSILGMKLNSQFSTTVYDWCGLGISGKESHRRYLRKSKILGTKPYSSLADIVCKCPKDYDHQPMKGFFADGMDRSKSMQQYPSHLLKYITTEVSTFSDAQGYPKVINKN